MVPGTRGSRRPFESRTPSSVAWAPEASVAPALDGHWPGGRNFLGHRCHVCHVEWTRIIALGHRHQVTQRLSLAIYMSIGHRFTALRRNTQARSVRREDTRDCPRAPATCPHMRQGRAYGWPARESQRRTSRDPSIGCPRGIEYLPGCVATALRSSTANDVQERGADMRSNRS